MLNTTLELIFTIAEVLIALACCLGNLLVMWAVKTCHSMRQQPTFCLIVSLAVADFLVGAVVVPLAVLVDGRVETTFHVCLFLSCVMIVLSQASVHSLLAIAIDRYLRVYIPLRYKLLVTQRRLWAVVGICWVTAGILGLIPMFGWYRHETLMQMISTNSTTLTCLFLSVIPMSYLVYFNFLTCMLLPILIMMTLYGYIFKSIHQHLQKGSVIGSESPSYYQKERSLACSLVLVLGLFALCWLPLQFMNLAAFFGEPSTVPHEAFYVGIFLCHANSAVNPVIYAFKVAKIKAAYKMIWRRYVLCRTEEQFTKETVATENYSSCVATSTTRNDQVRLA
ncbi:adenosine receptor A1-like [Denticeps clupeoides]|uniref:G-protein coupled receptors family 1 profile domain-containing protein n=1 Tax=Denticeps clupeoides TaxID=299321 RepID=A0AAY4EVN3_9TELE|nr:adenosine receptor A1-like [Denticeps clupeoides]